MGLFDPVVPSYARQGAAKPRTGVLGSLFGLLQPVVPNYAQYDKPSEPTPPTAAPRALKERTGGESK